MPRRRVGLWRRAPRRDGACDRDRKSHSQQLAIRGNHSRGECARIALTQEIKTMLRGHWIVAALIVPVTMILMSAGGRDSAVRAQAGKKLVRMASARGVIFYPLWGIEPFAEKYGIRTEMIPIMTNADQQRALQTGGADVASQGYVNPAIMAEQEVSNVKNISGLYVVGQTAVMGKE